MTRGYASGARVWLKYKSRQTTDAVIGRVTGSLHRPAALLLRRYASDTGRLHYAGRTTHLTDAQVAAVAPLLVATIGGHPWPAQLTVNWRSKPAGGHLGHGEWQWHSRLERKIMSDNIELTLRLHPVAGDDVSIMTRDFAGEGEALSVISHALEERARRGLDQGQV